MEGELAKHVVIIAQFFPERQASIHIFVIAVISHGNFLLR